MNESAIFNAAVKLPVEQRPTFVEAACAGNPQLRADVDFLLQEHDQAGSFLARPALEMQPTDLLRPITEGPGTVIGPYKLLQQIGEGGFGVVYMAAFSQSGPGAGKPIQIWDATPLREEPGAK